MGAGSPQPHPNLPKFRFVCTINIISIVNIYFILYRISYTDRSSRSPLGEISAYDPGPFSFSE